MATSANDDDVRKDTVRSVCEQFLSAQDRQLGVQRTELQQTERPVEIPVRQDDRRRRTRIRGRSDVRWEGRREEENHPDEEGISEITDNLVRPRREREHVALDVVRLLSQVLVLAARPFEVLVGQPGEPRAFFAFAPRGVSSSGATIPVPDPSVRTSSVSLSVMVLLVWFCDALHPHDADVDGDERRQTNGSRKTCKMYIRCSVD